MTTLERASGLVVSILTAAACGSAAVVGTWRR